MEVFESCLDTDAQFQDRRDATQLHRICAVCHLWKTVAEGNPVLWLYVSGSDPLQHINKALNLSGSRSITVFYDGELASLVPEEEFIAAVEPHAARWGHAMILYEDWNEAPVQVWESSKLSKLHTLELASNSYEYRRIISLGAEPELPNLREATFINMPLHLNPGQLPGLRTLQLSDYKDPETRFTISQLLDLLRGTPHLERLMLVDVEIAADVESKEWFALPGLTELHLDSVNPDGIRQFLSSIRLPQFNTDRREARHECSGEAPNNPNSIPYYERDLDVLKIRDRKMNILAGSFKLFVEVGGESSVLQFLWAVLEGFAKKLASSQHIHADIELTDRMARAVPFILHLLDQFPNFKSIQVIQTDGTLPLLTIIRLLGRPQFGWARDVWFFPHLETISVRVENPPFLELGGVCQQRGTAAATSGCPKAIKQLHIEEPLDSIKDQFMSQADSEIERNLDYLKTILGAGQLFWLYEPWPRDDDDSEDDDGSEDEPEPTL